MPVKNKTKKPWFLHFGANVANFSSPDGEKKKTWMNLAHTYAHEINARTSTRWCDLQIPLVSGYFLVGPIWFPAPATGHNLNPLLGAARGGCCSQPAWMGLPFRSRSWPGMEVFACVSPDRLHNTGRNIYCVLKVIDNRIIFFFCSHIYLFFFFTSFYVNFPNA